MLRTVRTCRPRGREPAPNRGASANQDDTDGTGLGTDRHLRDLQRLLPMWPAELADRSPDGRRALMAKLRRALREERRRGLAGHWAYDLARHAALYRAYRRALSTGFRSLGATRPKP